MREFIVIGFLLIFGCGSRKEQKVSIPQSSESTLSEKSVVMVIAHTDFRDEEFKEPYDLLKKSGLKVVVASTDTTPAKGMLGMVVKPELLIADIVPEKFNALIIVGGIGCRNLWDDATLHKLVQGFNQSQKTVAAICIAPVVLARAGILKDKKATVYPQTADEIKPHCAEYTGKDVEVSGNVITASGPHAAKDFAKAILEAVSK
ncbi:MAG: DJ-1/PfpI family protein [candidate division WOR-3 bacterium]|nr:DJ-1/PfpI family protein [candidate division WOR-3 bacterium]